MRALLGGKGANLAEMTRIGLPVPPGFTITTEVCTYYYENERSYPPQLIEQLDEALARIERSVGKEFGGVEWQTRSLRTPSSSALAPTI
jgi:pyruvate, orthophosphate dikinase